MKITDILVEDAVILDAESDTKSALLEEMAGALAAAVPGLEVDRLLKVLSEREALQSTGIGEGVAIPHGKVVGLDGLVASFARSRQGIDFDAIDQQPTHLFFLLVVPEHSAGQHLKALARISRFLRDDEFRRCLMEAEDLKSIFAAIEQEDGKF
ncbi:MAG: PTS sugar transporter subunit IIA [Myxococcota bacterium]|nr:PTS sugar transporter subunit IIA [Myxococcota bacterium]